MKPTVKAKLHSLKEGQPFSHRGKNYKMGHFKKRKVDLVGNFLYSVLALDGRYYELIEYEHDYQNKNMSPVQLYCLRCGHRERNRLQVH